MKVKNQQRGLLRFAERREKDRQIPAPHRRPRKDWAEAFRAAGPTPKDQLLLDEIGPNTFDRDEWQW
jgi:hypothetical protein